MRGGGWGGHGEEKKKRGKKEKEEKWAKRGGRGDPATPVIPGLVYGRQWPAGSQRSATLLQRLVDSAEWEITHQELTFRIWVGEGRREGGRDKGEALARWEGRRGGGGSRSPRRRNG